MVKVADVKPAGTWAEGFRIQARGWPSQGPRRHPRESAAPEREGGTVGPLAAAGWGHREVGRRRACSPVSASGQGGVPGRSRPGHCPLTFPVPAKACHLFLLLLLPPPKTGGGAGPPAPAPLPRGARDSPGGARRRTGGSGSARPLCCRGRWPEGPRAQGPHGVWGGGSQEAGRASAQPPRTGNRPALGLQPDVQMLSGRAAAWGPPPPLVPRGRWSARVPTSLVRTPQGFSGPRGLTSLRVFPPEL